MYKMLTAESFTSAQTAEELTKEVNLRLEEGWKLYVSSTTTTYQQDNVVKVIMTQTVVKD